MNHYRVLKDAIQRLIDIDDERENILKRFPVLRGMAREKPGPKPKKKAERFISKAARQKMSDAAKARWKKRKSGERDAT